MGDADTNEQDRQPEVQATIRPEATGPEQQDQDVDSDAASRLPTEEDDECSESDRSDSDFEPPRAEQTVVDEVKPEDIRRSSRPRKP